MRLLIVLALMFRPVRLVVGLTLFAVICFLAYGCATMPADAQASPMVLCQVGSWSQVMPDFACDAMVAGATKLRPVNDDPNPSLKACAVEMARYLEGGWPQMVNTCVAIFSRMRVDAVVCRTRGNC